MNAEEIKNLVEGERVRLASGAQRYDIPHETRETIIEYVLTGRPVGSFVYAVLVNDLRGAVNRADLENQRALGEIVKFLYNHVPSPAWGSEIDYDFWHENKGIRGLAGSGTWS
jgi:hypothetical protein